METPTDAIGALGGPQASQSSAMSPFASSFIKKLEEDNPKLEQNVYLLSYGFSYLLFLVVTN